MKPLRRFLVQCALAYACIVLLVAVFQRRLLCFPSNEPQSPESLAAGLVHWEIGGEFTGFVRRVENPRRVWLFAHGNGGQASEMYSALPWFNSRDSVYMLEYPGYGKRPGSPSQDAFNAAALSAYHSLLNRYGGEKLIVAGASLGSGVASYLATAQQPPRHIVLIVPFHVLTDVAQERFPWLPVGLLMVDRWNNGKALENFRGKLDVFGGRHDHVIPVHHARRLVASRSGARYHEYDGGHDWFNGFVDLRVIE